MATLKPHKNEIRKLYANGTTIAELACIFETSNAGIIYHIRDLISKRKAQKAKADRKRREMALLRLIRWTESRLDSLRADLELLQERT